LHPSPTPLLDVLAAQIAETGPLSLAHYMALALTHPQHGYYTSRHPLGAAGDFTTAPEISQLFGEMIGAWSVDMLLRGLGANEAEPLHLVELGPGRGTMMADALRVAASVPGLCERLRVTLVEVSPSLRAVQAETLKAAPCPLGWVENLDTITETMRERAPGAVVVLANEFFDALPIRQFVAKDGAFHERLITLKGGAARPVLNPMPAHGSQLPEAVWLAEAARRSGHAAGNLPEGTVLETRDADLAALDTLISLARAQPTGFLFIDYGYDGPAFGDSFQAVAAHKPVDPFATPGTADLTAHVDFERLRRHALSAGLAAYGSVPQGVFLERLGITPRAQKLAEAAPDAARADIIAAHKRLCHPDDMGHLFKVLALAPESAAIPAGFAPDERHTPRDAPQRKQQS